MIGPPQGFRPVNRVDLDVISNIEGRTMQTSLNQLGLAAGTGAISQMSHDDIAKWKAEQMRACQADVAPATPRLSMVINKLNGATSLADDRIRELEDLIGTLAGPTPEASTGAARAIAPGQMGQLEALAERLLDQMLTVEQRLHALRTQVG